MSFPNPLWLSDLVGGFNHLEKYEFVNGKDDIPYMKREIKFMFETTNQRLKLVYSFSNGQFVQDSKDPNLTHRESNFWANSDRSTLRKNWKQTTFVDKPLSNHHLWMLETSLVSLPLNSWLCAEKKKRPGTSYSPQRWGPTEEWAENWCFHRRAWWSPCPSTHWDPNFTVKWGVSILRHIHIALINLVSNWQIK